MILPADLFDIAREGLILVLLLCVPVLGATLLTGVIAGLMQTFLKVQEPSLTYVPRIIAVTLTVLATAQWIGSRIAGFAERVWSLIQIVSG